MNIALKAGLLVLFALVSSATACQWRSHAGATFDLSPLTVHEGALSYHIKDGDIPCTPEHEPTYSFMWNLCARVTEATMPGTQVCHGDQRGAAIQYLDRKSDGYKECHVIGKYSETNEANEFSLLASHDPSQGVSMKYPMGDKCPNGMLRSATIDVMCENVELIVDSALEPSKCQYHMVMRSYHGCPTECPVTSNGLCNSHGHCAYDTKAKKPYCYCNEGYSGSACDQGESLLAGSGPQLSVQYRVQVGLLVALTIVAILLISVVGFMVYKVGEFRKQHAHDYYSSQFESDHSIDMRLSGHGDTEMTAF